MRTLHHLRPLQLWVSGTSPALVLFSKDNFCAGFFNNICPQTLFFHREKHHKLDH
jgi:hypothetical protein